MPCSPVCRMSSAVAFFVIGGLLYFQSASAQQPFFNPDSVRLTGYAGSFSPNPEAQFVGARNKYSYGVNLGADLSSLPYLGLELELLGTNQDYDTPVAAPFGTLDNDTRVQTAGLLMGLRVFYPAGSSLRFYGVAGLGLYYVEMSVNGTLFGVPGVYYDDDRSVDFYYGGGISYQFEQWVVSIDYRNIELSGDFSGFQISNADLGGETVMLGIGYNF